MNWFKRNNHNKLASSGVFVTETDLSVTTVNSTMPNIVVGKTSKGPVNEPIIICPKTKPVEWYQFWRYSDRKKYNKEVAECLEKFHKIFGTVETKK